jgi:hypothetical protein
MGSTEIKLIPASHIQVSLSVMVQSERWVQFLSDSQMEN